jgi:hypothetical protein
MEQAALIPDTWCCGEDRPRSNFCPECGRQLRHGPLIDLLAHCEKILRQQRRNLQGAESDAKRRRYEQAVQTWEERRAALAAAIERAAE